MSFHVEGNLRRYSIFLRGYLSAIIHGTMKLQFYYCSSSSVYDRFSPISVAAVCWYKSMSHAFTVWIVEPLVTMISDTGGPLDSGFSIEVAVFLKCFPGHIAVYHG